MSHGAPSSSITYKWSFSVFLSYCDVDIAPEFTSLLRNSLLRTGLRVFPVESIRPDEDVRSTPYEAIHESRIAIIIFSENYANTARCLQEFEQILGCFKEDGRLLCAMFYDVDPSDGRHQAGNYTEAFTGRKKTLIDALVKNYRRVLSQAADFLPENMNIDECIVAIVERVTAWMKEKEREEEEEHDDSRKKEEEEEEEEHDENQEKEEQEEGHDDTIHETTDLSFWERKERIGSYDVFLSYRDANQFDFPNRLRDSLRQGGLSVYHASRFISTILNKRSTDESSKALHKSRIAIIVFSKIYTASAFHLKELVQILECFKGEGRLIYPVFYDVDHSEVRNQTGSYAEALSQAADLPGFHLQSEIRTMNADECIGKIVERVTDWMNKKDKFWVWDKGEEIGYGAHGIVYVAHHWKTRATCGAIKELNIYKADTAYEYILKEIEFLSQLKKHPNIVEYYGHKGDGGPISLFMEFIQTGSLLKYGSLKKYITNSKGGKLDEPLVQNFTAQILFGLVHLQSNRQVHRDLKPTNLLVDSKNIVKLVDFGLAKLLEKSSGKHSVGGTPGYAAPEVDRKQNYKRSHDALAADIWTLGCIIIEMFLGSSPPWSTSNSHPHIPEELCQEGKDFLERCFKIDPAERPSAKELLEDPFVKAQAVALKNTGLYKD